MLQSVRDNLKGTVVSVIVVLFFILPMVITGVGSSFLGSVAGTDAAVVEGRSITRAELGREVYLQKQRLLSQDGVDPSADFLKDENLAKPVLERLTRKEAIVAAAEKGGMGVSENAVNSMIVTQEEFQVDGKFSSQQFRSLLARVGLTPAAYKAALSEDLMLAQLNNGLELSSFVTEQEKSELLAIINEKRTFYSVDIPAEGLADSVSVSDDEIADYYARNKEQFREPEKVTVEYVETSVNALADTVSVNEDDIQVQYDTEVSKFDATPELEIAHILIEAEGAEKESLLAEVESKLADGEDFSVLAATYSTDAGTKELGGNLGKLVSGVFPEAFEQAARALNEGEVSPPVETDSGTHFIKVVSKTVPSPPTYEARKPSIERSLKIAKAEELYLASVDKLEELTFSAPDLASAAAELGVEVKTSSAFERNSGVGIAGNPEIRKAAFESDVLVDGHNSRVIELAGNRAVVIHKKTHSPEHIKSLEEVRDDVVASLTDEKVNALLEQKSKAFVEKAKAVEDVEQLASELGYSFTLFEDASRSDPVSDPATRNRVFSLPIAAEGETTYDYRGNSKGGYRVVGVVSKVAGSAEDMEPAQVAGMTSQLARENSRFEGSAFEADVVASADIKIH